jgi:FlaA1/EpsC-like NDP-sugar epimerase
VGIGLRKESLLSLFSFEIRTSALINVFYMAESKDMSQLSIGEFYENRSIFITGATGFIGKVLVEKILRCCPGVERLYLLMRPSKGQSVDYRLREFIQNEVSQHSAFIELTPKQK